MRHGVKCVLFASTQANANRLRDGITARIPAGSISITSAVALRYHDARFYAVCSFYAASETQADQFQAAIQTYWTSSGDATRALAGTHSRRFRNFEDEDPPDSRRPDVEVERRAK
jgi:hypothetical protein